MSTNLTWTVCQPTGYPDVTVRPSTLAKHPSTWSKDDVRAWLQWCTEEFSIDVIPPEKFDLNGKALCLLSKGDFIERLPSNGDVLYNCLQSLVSKSSVVSTSPRLLCNPPTPATYPGTGATLSESRMHLSNSDSDPLTTRLLFLSPSTTVASSSSIAPTLSSTKLTATHAEPSVESAPVITTSTTATIVAAAAPSIVSAFTLPARHGSPEFVPRTYVPIMPHPQRINTTSNLDQKGLAESNDIVDNPRTGLTPSLRNLGGFQHPSDCRLLWEFIYQLLLNTNYSNYVTWETREQFVFRIVNPTGLAELWGQQKNRLNMTYEKLSRALRYYYRMGIIRKVPGKRLTYQFLTSPSNIKKGQRGARPHRSLPIGEYPRSPYDDKGDDIKQERLEPFSDDEDVSSGESRDQNSVCDVVKKEPMDSEDNHQHRQNICPGNFETNILGTKHLSVAEHSSLQTFPRPEFLGNMVPQIMISDYGDHFQSQGCTVMDLTSQNKTPNNFIPTAHAHRQRERPLSTTLLRRSLSPEVAHFRQIKQESPPYDFIPFDLSKPMALKPRGCFMRSRSFDHIDVNTICSIHGNGKAANGQSVTCDPCAHVQSEPEDLSMKKTKLTSVVSSEEENAGTRATQDNSMD